MFGKPEWFRAKTVSFGLRPVRWQGWLYAGGWATTIALPFLLLVGRHQPLEAAAWLALSTSGLVYDVWQILRAMRGPSPSRPQAAVRPVDNVLYILDSQPRKQTLPSRV